MKKTQSGSTNLFADEAGDGTLFDRKGRAIVGTEGCSRFFALGLLQVNDPGTLAIEFNNLRTRLLADPYFKNVPSMQPANLKTSLAFHAKDDLPEVRREVFALLSKRTDVRFFGIIRDKRKLLSYVNQRNGADPAYRYHPNELYDYLVRRLFRDRLHQHDQYEIFFAKRGKSDRTQALDDALKAAQINFAMKNAMPVAQSQIHIIPSIPKDEAGLQAVDYFLWAVQRLYEHNEERFISLLWPACRLVMDIDDTRYASYGTYYDKKRPLTYEAIENRQ
jgi:hypothetical protein